MAFQIKDFSSIVASCINWMKSTQSTITDFNIGSVARTLIEAPAAEIDQLYQQMFNGLKEAIPVATYNSFNFAALPALPTSGLVRVTIVSSASATPIQAGTTFSIANSTVTYTSSQDMTIAAGNTYTDVLVSATQSGSVGNLAAAGVIFIMAPQPSGFVSATNLTPWINGQDVEIDTARQARFASYIQTLVRGTVAALNYGLQTTFLTDALGNQIERVVYSAVVEPYLADASQPISLVNCYIHNGVGSTSSALVTLATQIVTGYTDASGNKVPGWKAAGVKTTIQAATEQLLNVTGTLTAASGYDKPTLQTSSQQAIAAYLAALDIGATAVLSEMVRLVKSIAGVSDIVFSAPTVNTTSGVNIKIMPGTIAIAVP